MFGFWDINHKAAIPLTRLQTHWWLQRFSGTEITITSRARRIGIRRSPIRHYLQAFIFRLNPVGGIRRHGHLSVQTSRVIPMPYRLTSGSLELRLQSRMRRRTCTLFHNGWKGREGIGIYISPPPLEPSHPSHHGKMGAKLRSKPSQSRHKGVTPPVTSVTHALGRARI